MDLDNQGALIRAAYLHIHKMYPDTMNTTLASFKNPENTRNIGGKCLQLDNRKA
jgi:hypothetical protein